MKLIPKAGSPAAEPFPRDTSDHLAQTLDAYRENLLFHRLHGYPLQPYTLGSAELFYLLGLTVVQN